MTALLASEDHVHPTPLGLMAVGAGFVIAAFGVLVIFEGWAGVLTVRGLLGVGATSTFALGIVAGSYWLDRSNLDSERYGRVAAWCLGGGAVLLAFNIPVILAFSSFGFGGNLGWMVNVTCMGASGGLLVGLVEARSIQRALDAQRATLRAETAESQREWLDYLNSLLRHEVLNSVTVIDGYVDQLLDIHADDPVTRERLETVHSRSQDMAAVIQDVRVLVEATNSVGTFEPVDLASIVADEVADLREAHPDVKVDTDIPPGTTVRADHLLARAISNLLSNAAEHSNDPRVHIRVSAERQPDTVVLRIADNGPGLPDSIRDSPFERRDGNHGLGLYLVRVIVERYSGSVDLVETGPDGSTFVLELPRVGAN